MGAYQDHIRPPVGISGVARTAWNLECLVVQQFDWYSWESAMKGMFRPHKTKLPAHAGTVGFCTCPATFVDRY